MEQESLGRRCAALFVTFLKIGAFTFGGGYAMIPLIQRETIESRHWIDDQDLLDMLAIAESTPGTIAVNSATFVGIRIAGVGGAVIATLGCILPSCLIVSLLAFVYYRYKQLSALQSVLASLRPAVVALIASAGLSILNLVAFDGGSARLDNVNWLGLGTFITAFFILRRLKWNPILVMILCGAAGLFLNLPAGMV